MSAYLDDLVMYDLRHAKRRPILDRTLGILVEARLKFKGQKWHVFPDSIAYLGHIIKDWKTVADRSKLDIIRA